MTTEAAVSAAADAINLVVINHTKLFEELFIKTEGCEAL